LSKQLRSLLNTGGRSFLRYSIIKATDCLLNFILQYRLNAETGEWHHIDQLVFRDRKWLGHISFGPKGMTQLSPKQLDLSEAPKSAQGCMQQAEHQLQRCIEVSAFDFDYLTALR
jgi:hypothetical protein